jgi:hypothetical protein
MAFETVELNILRAAVRRTSIYAKDTAVMNLDGRVFLSLGFCSIRKDPCGTAGGR